MGSGQINMLQIIEKQLNLPLFRRLYSLFSMKKEHDKPIKLWQELNDITLLVKFGTLRIGVTKEIFGLARIFHEKTIKTK